MKEYTIIYNAEITEVVVAEELADIDKECRSGRTGGH